MILGDDAEITSGCLKCYRTGIIGIDAALEAGSALLLGTAEDSEGSDITSDL